MLKLIQNTASVIVAINMVTKRQLGLLFIVMGVGAIFAMFAIDLIGAGQFQGIGPAQRRALIVSGLVIFVGATLIPLGNRPA